MFFSDRFFCETDAFIPRCFMSGASLQDWFSDELETQTPDDLQIDLSLTLDQCYNGARVAVMFERMIKCTLCARNETLSCHICHGKGKTRSEHRGARSGNRKVFKMCTKCNGQGYITKYQKKCHSCKSNRLITENAQVYVDVPPGTLNKFQLRLRGKGNASSQCTEPGDLVIHSILQKHPVFNLIRNDLMVCHEIPLGDAITGNCRIVIEHLDLRKLLVEIDEVVTCGDQRVIFGEGMPIHEVIRRKCRLPSQPFGNLIIMLQLIFPLSLSPSHLEDLDQILPNTSDDIIDENIDEECTLFKRHLNESSVFEEVDTDNEGYTR